MSKRIVHQQPQQRAQPAPIGLLQQATSAQQQGQWADALSIYEGILALDSLNVTALCGQAEALLHTGQLERGLAQANAATTAHPNESACHITFCKLQQAAGEIEGALHSAGRACDLQPASPAGYVELARCLQRGHRLSEALTAIDQAIQLSPKDLFPASIKANILVALKEHQAALTLLEELVASPRMYPALARSTYHSLGMVRDRLGQYPGAFQAFTHCGQLTAQTTLGKKCNPQALPRMIEALRTGFTAARIERFATSAANQPILPAPTFLVGFPRSGTTMTEQILAAHPGITTSDEKPFMNAVRAGWAKLVGGSDDVGGMIERTTAEHVEELRRLYWERVDAVIPGPSSAENIFLDKLPLNIINLGLINLIFPEAKVITALRDPRDVCLSCFMQDFRLNNSMIHFLALPDTVRYYATVMDLYLHFRSILTLDLLQIRYEDTVADLEGQARQILALLELEWDDQILHFHEQASTRFISTPSAAAVTEPIHTKALQRWKNYAEHFEPAQLPLARFIGEFGYESTAD